MLTGTPDVVCIVLMNRILCTRCIPTSATQDVGCLRGCRITYRLYTKNLNTRTLAYMAWKGFGRGCGDFLGEIQSARMGSGSREGCVGFVGHGGKEEGKEGGHTILFDCAGFQFFSERKKCGAGAPMPVQVHGTMDGHPRHLGNRGLPYRLDRPWRARGLLGYPE